MSTKTSYSCDKCGAEFSDRKTLKMVRVRVETHYEEGDYYSKGEDWCIECLSAIGIVEKAKPQIARTPVPSPSIEDMIREIVQQEVSR